MGILLFVLKYMFIYLLLKMINGFSWPARIMASPFNLSRIFEKQWSTETGLQLKSTSASSFFIIRYNVCNFQLVRYYTSFERTVKIIAKRLAISGAIFYNHVCDIIVTGPYFIKVKIFLKSGFKKNWSSFVWGVEWVHGLFLFPLVLGKM